MTKEYKFVAAVLSEATRNLTPHNTAPLVVIDGVPGRNMDEIDPNDIESLSVLKDASAAIYGRTGCKWCYPDHNQKRIRRQTQTQLSVLPGIS